MFQDFCISRIPYIQPKDTIISMVFVISLASFVPPGVCWKGPGSIRIPLLSGNYPGIIRESSGNRLGSGRAAWAGRAGWAEPNSLIHQQKPIRNRLAKKKKQKLLVTFTHKTNSFLWFLMILGVVSFTPQENHHFNTQNVEGFFFKLSGTAAL